MNINEIDLRPKWLEMILRILAVHLPEAEVFAYGSRVTRTSHEGSDLDLVARNPYNLMLPLRNLVKYGMPFRQVICRF